MSFCPAVVILPVISLGLVGCGGPPPISDEESVMEAIANLSDAADDKDSFRELFVTGSVPSGSQRVRYSRCLISMEPPVVTGRSATVEVQVTLDGRESAQQWTLEQEDGVWKIQNAPLPK